LARPAPVKIRLDIRLGQFDARRAAIHDDAHAASMRFAPGGDAEKVAKGVHGQRHDGRTIRAEQLF